MVDVFHGGHSSFIGRSNGVPSLAASARHPDGHRVGIVVSSVSDASTNAIVRGAAKFTAPDNKRTVEKGRVL